MKILFIHHRLPYPLHSGMDKITWNLIKILSISHEITLVVPVDYRFTPPEHIEKMQSLGSKLIVVPVKFQREFRKWHVRYWGRFARLILFRPSLISDHFFPVVAKKINELCSNGIYDLVHASSLATAEYLNYSGTIPTLLLAHEVHYQLASSEIPYRKDVIRRLLLWLNCRVFIKYEKKSYKSCHRLLALSASDARNIVKLTGRLPFLNILPPPVESDSVPHSVLASSIRSHDPSCIAFVGGLGPSFNQDAVFYFCRMIFPLIKRRIPQAKFYIIGENPSSQIKNLEKNDGIIVTGAVPDVRPYLERAAVYVAPIRYSGGVKTKIIEALSMGKAIVASSVALEGLPDLGEGVFRVQDEPHDFADEVVKLLLDDELRISLGTRARDLFERSYSLKVLTPRILRTYEEIGISLNINPVL